MTHRDATTDNDSRSRWRRANRGAGSCGNWASMGTSAACRASCRGRATSSSLDSSHFTGQRRWSEDDLAAAVACVTYLAPGQQRLGLAGGGSATALKGHATAARNRRAHFGAAGVVNADAAADSSVPDQLSRAGSMLAASWFTMCGYEVIWPLEPCRYDLVVDPRAAVLRVQVKTMRRRAEGWQVQLTTSGHPTGGNHARTFYDPDEIDSFFVIDADLNYYLIPVASRRRPAASSASSAYERSASGAASSSCRSTSAHLSRVGRDLQRRGVDRDELRGRDRS